MAATQYRGYTEIPGSAVPDVPYRVNLVIREIDADVQGVAEEAAAVLTTANAAAVKADAAADAALEASEEASTSVAAALARSGAFLPVSADPAGFTARNATAPITTPTYDGSGSAVHPDVVSIPSGWNGFKYWMAMTPYHNQDIALENPSVLCSNDPATGWQVPAGVTNPLVPALPGGAYNSDTDLVLGNDNRLYMFWRSVAPAGTTSLHGQAVAENSDAIFVISSADGVNWTTPKYLFGAAATVMSNLSPAFLFDAELNQWICYTVNNLQPGVLRRRTAAAPIGPWAAPTSVPFVLAASTGGGRASWHIDVIKHGTGYYAVVQDTMPNLSGVDGDLYLATSRDGLTWKIGALPILGRRPDQWDKALYRSTIQPVTVNGSLGFDLWYSTKSGGAAGQRVSHTVIEPGREVALGQYTPAANVLGAAAAIAPYTAGDAFNRADGPIGASSSGHVWTAWAGAPVVAGRAGKASTAVNTKASIDGGLADGVFSVEITCPLADEAWLMFRVQDGTHYMRIGVGLNSRALTLTKVDTSGNLIGTFTDTPGDTFRLTVHASAYSLKFFVDGAFVGSWYNSGWSTATGIGFQTNNGNASFRNLTARRIVAGK